MELDMSRVVILTDIPADQKDMVMKVEQDGGATVQAAPQSGGLFTITATFPDPKPGAAAKQDAGAPVSAPTQKPAPAGPAAGGTAAGIDTASSLSDRVPIPPPDKMNIGLSACTEGSMLGKFGRPGDLTPDCSAATGTFRERVRQNFNVGPFKVTGLDYAVESLLQVFSDVQKSNQALFDQVKNEGMLCVRARRHNLGHYSNHSWGTAIDIYFGDDVVPQGLKLAHRGNLLLAPFFNRYGWYWGAGFSGDSVDSMHFELAEETIQKITDHVMFGAQAPSDAVGQVSYQPDPQAAQVLGDIMGLIKKSKAIQQQFTSTPAFLGQLPNGELIFDTELQLDTDGWPDGKGKGDSSWQPDTSLRYANSGSMNANEVPYFVLPLPKSWPAQFGIKSGDLASVVFKDKLAFAVFADQGPGNKLGEGSIELLRRLGEERIRPNGRVINSGMGPGVVTIVFPGSGSATPYQDQKSLLDYIDTRGSLLFLKLGGNLPSEIAKA
jgi:Fungal chitosanase of glycosyl hydrolase group 75/D-alanyl-D-alanine carboxypeptidase